MAAFDDNYQRQFKKTPRWGFVYLVLADTGAFKIGRTNCPPRRLEQLRDKYDAQLTPICAIEVSDQYDTESRLHQLFQRKALGHEWFALDDKDLRKFCTRVAILRMQAKIRKMVDNNEITTNDDFALIDIQLSIPGASQ